MELTKRKKEVLRDILRTEINEVEDMIKDDEDLMRQEVNSIICETCYLNEQCYRIACIRNPKELKSLRKSIMDFLK